MTDFTKRPEEMISPNTVTKEESDLLQAYRALDGEEQKEIMVYCQRLLDAYLKSTDIR